MELIYLWVEDYKNIKKQGFNFSPRFECKYDEKSNELTIDENKEYVSIFPENINVTAIVGENGSGKTNLTQFLRMLDLIQKNEEDCKQKIIIVYRDNLKNVNSYFATFPIKTNLNRNIVTSKYYFYLEEKNESFVESSNFTTRLKPAQKIQLEYKDIIEMIILNTLNEEGIKLSSFMYSPNRIYVRNNINTYFEQVFLRNSISRKDECIDLFEKKFDDYHKFLILEFLIKDFKEKKLHFSSNKNLRGLHADTIKDFNILKNKDLLVNQLYPSTIDISEKEYANLKDRYNVEIALLSIKEKKFYIKFFEYFIFDFRDVKNRNYSALSYGEKKLFGLFLNIHYFLNRNKENKIFILDEYDLGLHPQWQKAFISEIIYSLSKVREQITFILTSHSPFLISDLPKESVIFLKKDKETGNCLNDTKNTNMNTFGANIHTLLSDGFFMDGGLMGEFAKGKIDDVIDLLNSPGKLEEKELKLCKDVVSIIGEPILKKQLQRMLNNKLELSNKDEIDILKEEMDLLKHRMEILRKNK